MRDRLTAQMKEADIGGSLGQLPLQATALIFVEI